MGQQSIAHKISYLQKMADQFLILISGTDTVYIRMYMRAWKRDAILYGKVYLEYM